MHSNKIEKYTGMINMKLMEQDEIIILNFAEQRNIKENSTNDYIKAIKNYTNYYQKTLTQLLEEAETEEEKGIRWKNSFLRKRLIEYRNYLYKNYKKNTADMYFIRVKAIYKYKDIMIGDLPKINTKNMNNPTPLTFNDLPSPEILLDAINQSDPLLRSYILFASSSGCASNEVLHLTINDFIIATKEYHNKKDIYQVMNVLKDDVIPVWYIKRIKTNKYYTTFSSPESTQAIIDYLKSRNDPLNNDTVLFKVNPIYLKILLKNLNNKMGLGSVNGYGRLRTHTLRKYHASRLYNDGMNINTVDALQGRGKDSTHSAYFMEDTSKLKEEYIQHLPCLLINTGVKELEVKSPEYLELEAENEQLRVHLKESIKHMNQLRADVDMLLKK